ncbi:hypothetical protein Godav_014866 [Gossypium davidsonii]|uniref:Uncharacterized protein n=2 Tax=Gossypium TaxID=3633 RepID=A0A7J8RM15_GOSDV|nr:hypothetical protein [Gossypium davidsonii]MBA0649826.1 hypothetical protein [Gossypium klotzschianum]
MVARLHSTRVLGTFGYHAPDSKVLVEMLKGVEEQESMETRGREASPSRDILSILDGRVAKPEGSTCDVKDNL